MKVLLIGSSSDIAQYMVKNASSELEFIELTSNPTGSHQHEIDVQDDSTFPSVDGEIDGLVYFPGSINLRPFSGLKLKDFQSDYEINVLGLIKILKHYHKQFAENSSLVFISTVAAQVGMPFHSSIALCKSAIEGLCRSLAAEWSPKIRVNCVAPSVVQTKLAARLFRTETQVEQMNARHPLQKVGQPKNISDAIEFLLSDKSSWMTGQVLHVDGGLSTLKK
ncbi:SDR family oxidoreductase [Flavobacteriales bacterium]|jgi:3-oxoacyl-[acyl-carrier protein] reductase|nr:SDR family oxidoreductase [Flavobacteriales bacterium]MDB2675545.1 SDR family oxidoreductase [Flavobacteriales bacterium]